MQLGILGLPKVGKTTLFNTLTASRQETDKFAVSDKTNIGVANVRDERLERLRDLFKPRRYVPATIQYVDIPGIKKGESAESLDLAKLKTVDALVHVVRAFREPEILHSEGSIDPARDIATLDLELILADHDLVERRLERLDKAVKRGLNPEEQRERKLLAEVILPALEAETPLREISLDADDERRLRGFQLLSAKPMLVVLNVDEAEVAAADPAALGIVLRPAVLAVTISAPIEEEIGRLPPEEQRDFLADIGLTSPSPCALACSTTSAGCGAPTADSSTLSTSSSGFCDRNRNPLTALQSASASDSARSGCPPSGLSTSRRTGSSGAASAADSATGAATAGTSARPH